MGDTAAAIDARAKQDSFSGVIRVDHSPELVFAEAYGFADRAHGIANSIETRFGVASATKGLTALTVVSLIQEGVLDLDTTARSVLGPDLPLIDDAVTVEHLLAHRSGIGDYLDESSGYEVTDYMMPVSAHELATTEQVLRVLDGFPTAFPPGTDFAYWNGGIRGAGAPRRTGERHRVP